MTKSEEVQTLRLRKSYLQWKLSLMRFNRIRTFREADEYAALQHELNEVIRNINKHIIITELYETSPK